MNQEQYIQQLAEEFELPIEKVALVWSVIDKTEYWGDSVELIQSRVRCVLGEIFPL